VNAEETTTEEKTYTMAELGAPDYAYVVTPEAIEGGGMKLTFEGNWQTVIWELPADIDFENVEKITYNVTSGNADKFAFKTYTAENFANEQKPETQVQYGSPELVPDATKKAGIEYFGITSNFASGQDATPIEMTIDSVVFTVKKVDSNEGANGDAPIPEQEPSQEITAKVITTDVEKTYSLGKLTEKKLSNVSATHNEASGSMKLDYASKYAEADYEIPADIDFSKVKKIAITLKSGNIADLAIKTYTQADWDAENVYETDVEYGKGYLVPTTDLADVKYIGISSLPEGTTGVVVESITFTVAGSVTYPMSLLNDKNVAGVTVTVNNGSEKLDFAAQYNEITYEVPEDIDMANVKKISYKLTDGNAQELTVKTYTQVDWETEGVYETEAVYWQDYIEPAKNVSDIKYIALANNGTVAKSITVESVTFSYAEASSVGVNPDAEDDSNEGGSDTDITAKVTTANVEKTYSLGKLKEKSLSNVKASYNEASGSMKLEYANLYAEADYEIPEDIDFSKVKKIAIKLKSGDVYDLALKTYTQKDWDAANVYETDVDYRNGFLVPTKDLADVKYIGISSLYDGANEVVVESITFTVEGSVTYPMSLLEELNVAGVTVTVNNGSEKLDFAGQYNEITYKVPADINMANVKKISYKLTDGNTQNLTVKTYTQTAWETEGVYETDVEYWADAIVPKKDVADVKYIALANGGAEAKSVTVESVTFTYAEASSEGVNPDAEDGGNTGNSDLTFTADEVSVQWGNATSKKEDGKINIGFANQYDQVKIQLPQSINMANCESVTFVVADQNIPIALKLWVGTEESERWVQYGKSGSTEYVETPNISDTIDVVGIMCSESSIPEGSQVSFVSVTFKMKAGIGSGSTTPDNLIGENIILNGNFADADVSMWNSAQGANSVISAETANEAIFDEVTTYGKISRDPAVSGTGDAFVQDITDRVVKGAEYYIEFYAMLSDEYADAPDNQKKIEFAPYFVLDGSNNYLGTAYSSELQGFKTTSAKVGEWTKYSGYFTISCRGEADRIVLRFIEQGTDYGQGDCVKGDYYITGVSMRQTDKPVPEIPEIEQDIPDWRDTIVGDLGEGTIAGTAVTSSEMRDETLWELVTKHFNAVTFGNELKMDAMLGNAKGATEQITFNGVALEVPVIKFEEKAATSMLDKILAWNTANPDKKLKVRGHVLVWHSQAPDWFFKENYDVNADFVSKAVMDLRLEWYIKTVLEYYTGADSKYKDLFYGWDVVNEAISDGTGTYRATSEGDGGNPNEWASVYGSQSNEYIIKAFQWANKYAPASLELYYNDYNDCVPSKVEGIVKLLEAVKAAEGTRIDGMGMQAHHNIDSPSVEQVDAAVRAYCAVVGKVQWTELDIKASSSYDGTDATREEEYNKMAYRYKAYYDVLKKLDAEDGIEVSGIVFWGTVDKYSWLQTSNSVGGSSSGGKQCPLLFDDNYKAKPAYWAFVDPTKLTPEVKDIIIAQKVDDEYTSGSEYSMEKGATKATVIPMWDNTGLKVVVKVQDATVDATDAVTVYVDPAMSAGATTPVKATVKRADAKAVSGGYEAEIAVALDSVGALKKVAMDVVVVNGTDKIAFNDTTLSQATSSKYYSIGLMKVGTTVESGTIVVDGEIDERWATVEEIPLSLGSVDADPTFKVLWDKDYLYVLADVKDTVLNKDHADAWMQDSIEVFIDENNKKTTGYDDDDKQYRINYANEQSFNGQKCKAENVISATKTVDGGYVIEAAFKWTDITPVNGSNVGFELQLNDAVSSSVRNKINWADDTDKGWSGSNVFGTITLVGAATLPELVEDLDKLVDENATLAEKTEAAKDIIAEVKGLVEAGRLDEVLEANVEEIEALFKESINRVLNIEKENTVPEIKAVIGAIIGMDLDKEAKMVFESISAPTLDSKYKNAFALDIKLFADDAKVQPLVPVTIRMAVPASIDQSKKVVVLHYADGATTPEKLNASITGGFLEFASTSFSTFVIANEVENQNTGGNTGSGSTSGSTTTSTPVTPSTPSTGTTTVVAPLTGDNAYPMVIFGIMMVMACVAVLIGKRREEEK